MEPSNNEPSGGGRVVSLEPYLTEIGMTFNPDKHCRCSIRLRDYDYSLEGVYFVTICTRDRSCPLGRIVDGEVCLNPIGEIVAESWQRLEVLYQYVELDQWVVMPNHMHGIIVISENSDGYRSRGRGASRSALIPGGSRTAPTEAARKPLGRLIGSFKTMSTKTINQILGSPGVPFWQRNYYEHVIRNETSLCAIREYIASNPFNWSQDPDFIPYGVPLHKKC